MYMYTHIRLQNIIRYVRSSLTVVVYFLVKSESKRSPGTNFAEQDMKENIRAIFAYIYANCGILKQIE